MWFCIWVTFSPGKTEVLTLIFGILKIAAVRGKTYLLRTIYMLRRNLGKTWGD